MHSTHNRHAAFEKENHHILQLGKSNPRTKIETHEHTLTRLKGISDASKLFHGLESQSVISFPQAHGCF